MSNASEVTTRSSASATGASTCDESFGPAALGCRPWRFDLTLLFEQSILTIGPCVLLLLVVFPRVAQLLGRKPKVLRHPIGLVKIVAYFSLVSLHLALLIIWAGNNRRLKPVSLAAASLGLVGALALGALSCLEHRRSVRPSSVVLVYLVFSCAFDAVQCRTLWLLDEPTLAPVFSVLLACKLFVLALELSEKRHILLPPWKTLPPEATSSIISKSVFWWLNGLLLRGFRTTLQTDTLYELDRGLKSKFLLDNLLQSRQKWAGSTRISPRYRLLLALVDSLKRAMAATAFPRLCLIGFKFAQPFLIKQVIQYLQQARRGDAQKEIGYSLVGATGLVYVGTAISRGFYQQNLFRSLTMIRGSLVSLVYIHTLNVIHPSAGDAALTLIGPDVMAITRAFETVHEIWANPIEVALAIWLLARELGPGCVGPAVAVIVCTIAMSRLSNYMGPAMKAWNEAIQQRISTTSSVIGSAKEVKMLGMAEPWVLSLQSLRVTELQRSKRFRTFIAYMNVLGNTPSALAPILTFGVAIAISGEGATQKLSIATAFTSLTIISLICSPLAHLLASVPSFFSCIGSFERIEAFVEANTTSSLPASTHDSMDSDDDAGTSIRLDRLNSKRRPFIKANNVSFSTKVGEKPVLRDLSFTIEPSKLTVITGKVGSGKSMLLLGILGELHASGKLQRSVDSAAFCAQAAWLVNATIQQNIVGPADGEIDQKWYETVVKACALDLDFQQLRDGDQSFIGSKGLSLSGGQRLRVALARAIYARNPTFLADDIFAGLDAQTRRHVWFHVFGPAGLLRSQQCTTILATHMLEFLCDADHIIILDGGRILNQGSINELRDSISSLQHEQVDHDASSSPLSESHLDQKKPERLTQTPNGEEEDDLSHRRTGDTSLYLYYFRSIGWKLGLAALTLAVIAAFLAQFSQIWLKWWTESNDGKIDTNTAMFYGVYVALLCIWVAFIGIDCWFMFVVVIPKSAEWLHWNLLKSIMNAPMTFLSSVDSGDLINRFSQDMSLVDRELPTAAYTSLAGLLACIGEAILIILGAKYLAAALPLIIFVLYILQKFYLRTSRQLRLLDLQTKAPLYTQLLELIQGLATIRAFQWQSVTAERSLALLDESQRPHYLLYSIQRWLTLVLDMLVAVSAVLLVLFGVTMGASTPGNMAIALYSVLGFSESLANLLSSWTSLETSLGAISRLKKFEKETPQENHPSLNSQVELPPAWPARGHLEWRNVEASYAKQPDGRSVLHDISLVIQPGQKVAICGRTGSGKSTLLATVLRLLDYSGTIAIDGIDISSISVQALRSSLIVVPQHPVLFPGSLRSNLVAQCSSAKGAGQRTTDDDVIALLERLRVWDAVCQSGSLDTDVDDLALSHGQKQLLCLGRAILRKNESRIVILDEATSAVDIDTEQIMVDAIDKEFAEHTVVSVVHRLNTVRNFDTLVELNQGRIVQVGAPAQLITASGQLRKKRA
ncbi:hypothetical protein HIM_00754 [Hirsutella minnesotensis 3608]|nr:hypothetical protein HIM_00754 [Hirsutella minnesotensis 3608]